MMFGRGGRGVGPGDSDRDAAAAADSDSELVILTRRSSSESASLTDARGAIMSTPAEVDYGARLTSAAPAQAVSQARTWAAVLGWLLGRGCAAAAADNSGSSLPPPWLEGRDGAMCALRVTAAPAGGPGPTPQWSRLMGLPTAVHPVATAPNGRCGETLLLCGWARVLDDGGPAGPGRAGPTGLSRFVPHMLSVREAALPVGPAQVDPELSPDTVDLDARCIASCCDVDLGALEVPPEALFIIHVIQGGNTPTLAFSSVLGAGALLRPAGVFGKALNNLMSRADSGPIGRELLLGREGGLERDTAAQWTVVGQASCACGLLFENVGCPVMRLKLCLLPVRHKLSHA